ncbi:MAG: nucleotidyltransferase domain-containing protein [Nanoarchaeota archaeon]
MKDILIHIKPGQQEVRQLRKATAEFLHKLNSKLKPAKATAILGGSGAKDTWLAGNHDVDIFVCFDYQKYADRTTELSKILKPYLALAFPGKRRSTLHGSRDYFQMTYGHSAALSAFTFEIIPILKIRKAREAKNITDVSPLHARWVSKNAKTLKDEIRLAKQFLRAQGLYGAESYIAGFSGYVVEILAVYYGSFKKLLKASQQWKVKEVIDVENHYPKKDALFQLNKSKTQSPLIVIDPVDKSRNAAAALSLEKFLKLKEVAKKYLVQPLSALPTYFVPEQVNLSSLQKEAEKKKLNLVYVVVQPVAGKEDVVGMKLVKVFDFLRDKLKPFLVVKSGWKWDKNNKNHQQDKKVKRKETFYYFLLEKRELPKLEVRTGPPLDLKEHVAGFKKRYTETFVQDGRVMAKVPVKEYLLPGFVHALLNEKYVQERIKNINNYLS